MSKRLEVNYAGVHFKNPVGWHPAPVDSEKR